jgi:hypothetical protein
MTVCAGCISNNIFRQVYLPIVVSLTLLAIIFMKKCGHFHTSCQVVEWLSMGFLDWWLGLLDYLIQHVTTRYISLLQTHTLVSTVMFSLAVARYRLLTAEVPLTLGSRSVPDLGYQLVTATAHNDWAPEVLWLIHSSLTALLITCRHGPHRKHRPSVAAYGSLPSNESTCHNIYKSFLKPLFLFVQCWKLSLDPVYEKTLL